MDSTPPSDVPDPASPTPTTGQPTTLPAAGSLPDGPGKIRSVPSPVNRTYRLPGTYAANFGGEDMNWRRGRNLLFLLFGLTAATEIARGACCLLGEISGWPAPGDLFRAGLNVLVFVLLWLGWGWARWVLVATGFFGGIMTALAMVGAPRAGVLVDPQAAADTNTFLVTALPAIVLGLLALVTAGYLALSTDVLAFVRHRRETGQGWTVAPVAMLGAAYLLTLLFLPGLYVLWARGQPERARRFGDVTARRMAERWDPQSVAGLGNRIFDEKWSPEYQRAVFASLVRLGPMVRPGEARLVREHTIFDLAEGGFVRKYEYSLPQVRFEHGDAEIGILIVKPLFRPWGIEDLEMQSVHFDPPPSSPTAASPAPAPATAPGGP